MNKALDLNKATKAQKARKEWNELQEEIAKNDSDEITEATTVEQTDTPVRKIRKSS